jgi:ketosteroid isomerase-like protein
MLLGCAFLAGCASPPTSGSPAEKARIEQRIHEIFSAAETKDFERLESYHLYGPQFTKYSGASAQRLDAEAARIGESKGLGAVSGLKMRADDLKIDLFNGCAIATFILDYSFTANGEVVRKRDRSTLVFVKDGSWRIAHEHLSPVAP